MTQKFRTREFYYLFKDFIENFISFMERSKNVAFKSLLNGKVTKDFVHLSFKNSYHHFLANLSQYTNKVFKNHRLNLIQNISSKPYLVGDHPVVLNNSKSNRIKHKMDFTFLSNKDHFIVENLFIDISDICSYFVPLSPKKLLLIAGSDFPSVLPEVHREPQIEIINIMTTVQSTQFVYSNHQNFSDFIKALNLHPKARNIDKQRLG